MLIAAWLRQARETIHAVPESFLLTGAQVVGKIVLRLQSNRKVKL
jgi:hypothetical protein